MQTSDNRGAQGKYEKPVWLRLLAVAGGVITASGLLIVELIGSGYLRPTIALVAVWFVLVVFGILLDRIPEVGEWVIDRIVRPAWNLICWGYQGIQRAGERLIDRFAAVRQSGLVFKLLILVILAAFAFVGALLGGAAFARLRPSPGLKDAVPCHQPLELRVLASAENRDAVQRAADRFAEDLARDRKCRPVHLTVFAEPSFSEIRYAFAHRWLDDPSRQQPGSPIDLYIGPQPDVWLPGSSAVVDYIAQQPHPTVDLDFMGSTATSPIVFAAPVSYSARLQSSLPPGPTPTLRDLVNAAPKAGLTVARPDPDLSETGLLATADLYRASRDAHDPDGDRRAVEGKVASVGRPLSSAQDLFCSIRTNFDRNVAAIVPEQTVFDFDQAKPLGAGCPLPIARPHVTYYGFRSADAHSLDYPFVRLTWRGQADMRRDAAIEEFKAWLDRDHFHDAGFRDTHGRAEQVPLPDSEGAVPVHRFSASEIKNVVVEYPRARPPLTVAVAFDMSGSMNNPGFQSASRLDRARQLAAQALELFGSADAVGLFRFPGGRAAGAGNLTDLAALRPGTDVHLTETANTLAGLARADGASTPLYDAINGAVEKLSRKGANPAVVVFTDGDNHISGGISAAQIQTRTDDDVKARIVVLAVGPKACAEPDLLKLTNSKIVTCKNATSAEPDLLMSQVIEELRRGTTT